MKINDIARNQWYPTRINDISIHNKLSNHNNHHVQSNRNNQNNTCHTYTKYNTQIHYNCNHHILQQNHDDSAIIISLQDMMIVIMVNLSIIFSILTICTIMTAMHMMTIMVAMIMMSRCWIDGRLESKLGGVRGWVGFDQGVNLHSCFGSAGHLFDPPPQKKMSASKKQGPSSFERSFRGGFTGNNGAFQYPNPENMICSILVLLY